MIFFIREHFFKQNLQANLVNAILKYTSIERFLSYQKNISYGENIDEGKHAR